MSPRDVILAVVIAAVWGLSFVAVKLGGEGMPPLLASAGRFFLAAVPAVFFVPRPKTPFRTLFGYGFAIGVVQFGFLFVAIRQGMPAGLASVVIQIQVAFTMLLAGLFLGERPTRLQYIGCGVAIAGIVVLAFARGGHVPLVPFLMTVLAAVGWAFGNLVTKRAGRIEMIPFVIWSSLIPPIPLIALSLLLDGPQAFADALTHTSMGTVIAIASLGWIATDFGFGMSAVLLSRYPAAMVSPFALLVPVFGISGGMIFLGERFGPGVFVGCAIVLAGVAINVFGPRIVTWLRPRRAA
ncbi:EamA family transporter [Methyloraptor flagellatus]|uniref:EamA family transporter n=1 Tax=Methyloraptor flagellatus TaxID=3162530 RepID=A0AAU7X8H8_9HYPH